MEKLHGADIFKDLNTEQKIAVETIEGPLLILAGAGSGKTKALTHRIANILNNGTAPWSILAITFTNKAAREMKQRVIELIGLEANNIWISTFHSMCVSILRKDIHHLGYSKSFTILDTTDQLNVIKQIMKELNIDIKKFEPKAILSTISNAKNELKTPDLYGKLVGDFFQQLVLEVYEKYQARLKVNNSVDFDDLIMLTVQLFQKSPETLEFYQRKFQYIHIDEYQDTNRAQYMLVKMLADYHKNICVVGDTDQSIYKWRGADIGNILSFEKDFQNTKVILLEQNYRSTKNILTAANAVIKNNAKRKKKNLWTENPIGNQINLYRASNEHEEAYFIAEKILSGVKDNREYKDYSILYRTNAQSRIIEEVLIKSNIPYKIFGGIKFYDRREIKDIMAYMRLIVNLDDDISLRRVINTPKRGIGTTTLEKIAEYAASQGVSIFSAIKVVDFIGLGASTSNKVSQFAELIINLSQLKDSLSVTDITEKILVETNYIEELKKEKSLEAESRVENIRELLSVTMEFEKNREDATLEDFLSDVALVSDIDQVEGESDNIVTLMTLHSAKGLEFPVVFITGLEEGIFPHNRALIDEEEMEEERRLAYVGITRAGHELNISNAATRMLFGRNHMNASSRFISELPDDLIFDVKKEERKARSIKKSTSLDNHKNAPNSFNWSVGDKANHKTWGVGVVVSTKNDGDNLELQIAFSQPIGIKKLLAKFAPLEKIE